MASTRSERRKGLIGQRQSARVHTRAPSPPHPQTRRAFQGEHTPHGDSPVIDPFSYHRLVRRQWFPGPERGACRRPHGGEPAPARPPRESTAAEPD